MNGKAYSIGELSALSSVSVRRIRFYSDKGLLPPAARTAAGYRTYSETDLARLDLIRALRESGVNLETIRMVLSRRLTLTEVLQMRLGALEAEIALRRRMAAVLRATLRASEPTEADLRRLWTMTTFSKSKLRETLEGLFDKVTSGHHMGDAWKAQVIDSSTLELPDEPTPEQVDAWNDIMGIITGESEITGMRAEMVSWNDESDPAVYAEATKEMLAMAHSAIDKGEPPTSAAGTAIAREWLGKVAKAMMRKPDETFMEWARKHHARSSRYQKLLAILRGDGGKGSPGREWLWLHEAMKPLLASTD